MAPVSSTAKAKNKGASASASTAKAGKKPQKVEKKAGARRSRGNTEKRHGGKRVVLSDEDGDGEGDGDEETSPPPKKRKKTGAKRSAAELERDGLEIVENSGREKGDGSEDDNSGGDGEADDEEAMEIIDSDEELGAY